MTVTFECPASLIGPARARVDWRAFAGAMALTPLTLALAGAVLIVPVFAAIAGLPAMLLLGVPAAWLAITRHPLPDGRASVAMVVFYAFAANFLSVPLAMPLYMAAGESLGEALTGALAYAGLGMIFAPIEGLIFALLYRRFARPAPPPGMDPDVFS